MVSGNTSVLSDTNVQYPNRFGLWFTRVLTKSFKNGARSGAVLQHTKGDNYREEGNEDVLQVVEHRRSR